MPTQMPKKRFFSVVCSVLTRRPFLEGCEAHLRNRQTLQRQEERYGQHDQLLRFLAYCHRSVNFRFSPRALMLSPRKQIARNRNQLQWFPCVF